MSERPNLHKLRRTKTREALRQAALKRFASEGFGNVTVEQLAQEAGVTERTFFRHFPSKEAVLFQDYDTQVEWLADALAQRPSSESLRSEERRVGKECRIGCRSRWSPYH